MEKNSAPRLPRRALSRLRWPMSLGSVEPMSKFSSRKRCGVSAWVSTTRAESWRARARALTVPSEGFEDCAVVQTAASRIESKREQNRVIGVVYKRFFGDKLKIVQA